MKKFVIISLFIFIPVFYVYAQDSSEQKKQYKFFISTIGEIVSSRSTPGFGGGLMIGSEDRISIGARAAYFIDQETIHSTEVAVFIRFYILKSQPVTGLYIQVNTGVTIFTRNNIVSLPADLGIFSASLLAGWRFDVNERWFLDFGIRGGFPYYIGTGMYVGLRF